MISYNYVVIRFILEFKEVNESNKLARKLSSNEFIEAEMLDTNKTINNFYSENYDLR